MSALLLSTTFNVIVSCFRLMGTSIFSIIYKHILIIIIDCFAALAIIYRLLFTNAELNLQFSIDDIRYPSPNVAFLTRLGRSGLKHNKMNAPKREMFMGQHLVSNLDGFQERSLGMPVPHHPRPFYLP